MKRFSKLGLLVAVALLASATMAAGAQAQVDVNPDNTLINGTSSEAASGEKPTLVYEGVTVVCDTGTAVGTTGQDSDIVDVEVDFFDNCNLAGLAATVDCSGTARLMATDAINNFGIVDALNPGFSCVVSVAGVCTVTVLEQDLPSDVDGTPGSQRADLIGEGTSNPDIDAEVDVEASRSGSTLCGPEQGDGRFTALYDMDTAVTFD
jgi:hypothetical protein